MERSAGVRARESALDPFVRRALRERQKRDLGRERDRIVLDLAASLGTDGLAQSLGTTAATAELLVQRARERATVAPGTISARRVRRDPERWSEVDRHFEALGRSAGPPADPPRPS
jgi:hypothetical protein